MPRRDQGNFCIWFLQIATINFTIFDGLLFSSLISPVKNTFVDFNRDAYLGQSYSAYVLVITRECLQET